MRDMLNPKISNLVSIYIPALVLILNFLCRKLSTLYFSKDHTLFFWKRNHSFNFNIFFFNFNHLSVILFIICFNLFNISSTRWRYRLLYNHWFRHILPFFSYFLVRFTDICHFELFNGIEYFFFSAPYTGHILESL